MNLRERVATVVMGWELLDIEYEITRCCEDAFYNNSNAEELVENGTRVVVALDAGTEVLVTPSAAKWRKLIEEEEVYAVGLYYVARRRAKQRIIRRRDWDPFHNAHDDYEVLRRIKRWPGVPLSKAARQAPKGISYRVGDWARLALKTRGA